MEEDIKFSVVYTLVSSGENDNYLEQLLLSIYSLRKHNDIRVYVLIDKSTDESLVNGREILKDVANVIVVDTPDGFSAVERSRYLKIHFRQEVDGTLLFIDADTMILDNLSELCDYKDDILMSPENLQFALSPFIQDKLKSFGCSCKLPYFNSGVIYCKDNDKVHKFFDDWYSKWLEIRNSGQGHRDQEPLACVNDKQNFIRILPTKFNSMICMHKLYETDKIIHYWQRGKFGTDVLKRIKTNRFKVEDADYDDFINSVIERKTEKTDRQNVSVIEKIQNILRIKSDGKLENGRRVLRIKKETNPLQEQIQLVRNADCNSNPRKSLLDRIIKIRTKERVRRK